MCTIFSGVRIYSSTMKTNTNMSSRNIKLGQRQQIFRAVREDLYAEGFLEVETPLLVKATCPDVHIDSIEADEGYLVTSTEYQIKRLIAGGLTKVFTLTKNFRAGDRGRYHSSEFTMLEWARAHESLKTIEEDAVRFIRKAFCQLHPSQSSLHFANHEIDIMHKSWEHLTVRQAFQHYLNITDVEDFSLKSLCHAAEQANIDLPADFKESRNLVMSFLLDKLQPYLGMKTPTFIHEWPAFLTASAPMSGKDAFTVERTELYIGGIEISNGFPFLTDAKKQKELFDQELKYRKEQGRPPVKIDEHYLKALEHLPHGAGMALGMDRLVMVLTGSKCLTDVQAFGWDEL